MNGAEVTIVDGQGSSRGFNLGNTVCTLEGLTITNGHSGSSGGGIYCSGVNPVINRCIISGNTAGINGGGVIRGVLNACTIDGNTAGDSGGGSVHSILNDCEISRNQAEVAGGGAYIATLYNCVISNNWVGDVASGGSFEEGGGTAYCTVSNSTIILNVSAMNGGGDSQSTLFNCLIVDNHALDGDGGGTYGSTVDNCTIVGNSVGLSANDAGGTLHGIVRNSIVYENYTPGGLDNFHNSTMSYSCTTPDPGGVSNVISNPLFVNAGAGDYRLQAASPCIDKGISLPHIIDDIDGTARPLDGDNNGIAVIDIGAYEFCHATADTDGDTLTDREEFVCQTDGTDGGDFFIVGGMSINSPVALSFESSALRNYRLIMNEDLVTGVWTNVPGMGPRAGVGGSDFFIVTNNNPQCSYSVRVEMP